MLFTSEQSKTLWKGIIIILSCLPVVKLFQYSDWVYDCFGDQKWTGFMVEITAYSLYFFLMAFYLYNLGKFTELFVFLFILVVLYYLEYYLLAFSYKPYTGDIETYMKEYELGYEAYKQTYQYQLREIIRIVVQPAAVLMLLRKKYVLIIPAFLLAHVTIQAGYSPLHFFNSIMDPDNRNILMFIQLFLMLNTTCLLMYILFMLENSVFKKENVLVARREFNLFLAFASISLITVLPPIRSSLFSRSYWVTKLPWEVILCGLVWAALLIYLIFWLYNRKVQKPIERIPT